MPLFDGASVLKNRNSSASPFELRRRTHPCSLPEGEYRESPLGRGFREWVNYYKKSMRQILCVVRSVVKIISFITDQQAIRQILKHLGLWTPTPSRDPPGTKPPLKTRRRSGALA